MAQYEAGQLESGEDCCRTVLSKAPNCPQALHLMGLIMHQTGRFELAVESLREANAADPTDPDILTSLAASCLALGDVQQAMLCYQSVVELSPASASAWACLGLVQDRLDRFEEAAQSFRRAVSLNPEDPEFVRRLAAALCKSGALQEALGLLDKLLARNPGDFETYKDLGFVLTEIGQPERAVAMLQQALSIIPNSGPTLCNLGHFFFRNGDLRSAADSYRCAIERDPELVDAHRELGLVLYELGEFDESSECFRRVQEMEPASAAATFQLSRIHLLQGDFSRGWQEYGARWTSVGQRERREFSAPQWKGEPLGHARILLHAEQGLGDTMQFVRYVPFVSAMGAEILLEVQPELHRLLSGFNGAKQVLRRGEPLPDHKWHCPLLSLPLAFGTKHDSIPTNVPYLHADPINVSNWQRRLGGDSVRVGLCWSGNPKHPRDFWRSIPLELFAPLMRIENATFYSLQKGAAAEQIARLKSKVEIDDLGPELTDFEDTAAVIANLDVVISVDTSIAHLAGGMGKPVWVLLHRAPDWRWLLERETSPWYPTARLFRQRTPGKWKEVLSRVESELRQLASSLPRAVSTESSAGTQ